MSSEAATPKPTKTQRIVSINGEQVLLDDKARLNVISTYGKSARLYEVFSDGDEILISLNALGETVIPLRKANTYRIRGHDQRPLAFEQDDGSTLYIPGGAKLNAGDYASLARSGKSVIGTVFNTAFKITMLPVTTAKAAYSTACNTAAGIAHSATDLADKALHDERVVKTAGQVSKLIPGGSYVYSRIFTNKPARIDTSVASPDEFGSREFLFDTKTLAARKHYLEQEYVGEKSPSTKAEIRGMLFGESAEPAAKEAGSGGYFAAIKGFVARSPIAGVFAFGAAAAPAAEATVDDDSDDPFAYRRRLYAE